MLAYENGPFFLNDLTDHQKNHIKTAPGAWQGCLVLFTSSLGLWNLDGVLPAALGCPWGQGWKEKGEGGGVTGIYFEEVELCFYP